MFTDTTDRNSHPFVTKCYEMSLQELKQYHELLVAKFNRLYEKAFESADTYESRDWEHGEEVEERANIADEVYCNRAKCEITD